MSFLAGPNQKLHTDAFARVIKGRPAEYQYDALKPEKKIFFSEVENFFITK